MGREARGGDGTGNSSGTSLMFIIAVGTGHLH